MGHLRKTSNYSKIIVLYDLSHMMSMVDFVDIVVQTPKTICGCSLEIEFTKLICMNP